MFMHNQRSNIWHNDDCRGSMKIISHHTLISILVDDQDEALQFYTGVLGLEKREDILFAPGLRLVTVAACGQCRPMLALARPDPATYRTEHIQQLITHTGQRIASIFATRDCQQRYEDLIARGVTFISTPVRQLYGVEAIFIDPYANAFSLLEAVPGVLDRFEHAQRNHDNSAA
ncbi:VOC family protein [Ktedonobacteria bacterium brp13]|nr:VOC family protein [Ktedonobacteria bacterium brp13]